MKEIMCGKESLNAYMVERIMNHGADLMTCVQVFVVKGRFRATNKQTNKLTPSLTYPNYNQILFPFFKEKESPKHLKYKPSEQQTNEAQKLNPGHTICI